MAKVQRRERAKTWSLLGNVRKKPSRYEAVTAMFHYHFRREPAPFELDPNTPINRWYLTHREGSPLQAESWEGFRDPYRLDYHAYVHAQSKRESYLNHLVDEFERRDHESSLDSEWVRLLEELYLPARFPIHVMQMTELYVAQIAPSSFITNAAYFQAADELRRIQWIAYRAKSLSLTHYPELASSEQTRLRWEEDASWQPMREAVEKMLIAYDWGEAFTALNLVVKPLFDELYNVQLVELARANNDDLLALMLDEFMLDSQRSRDWSSALVKYAVKQRVQNQTLFQEWVGKWIPLAYRGIVGLTEKCRHRTLQPKTVLEKIQAAHQAFLTQCGL